MRSGVLLVHIEISAVDPCRELRGSERSERSERSEMSEMSAIVTSAL